MRLGLFRLVLALMSFAMTLAFGEAFVRVLAPQPTSWLAIYRSHPDLAFFSLLPNQRQHVDTGETEWTVITDEAGYRMAGQSSSEGKCTALWLGDSFAFGHGVEYEESFIGQIEERTAGVHHLNSAVPGYGPIQYRRTLEYLGDGRLDFDWIFVASYVGNDFHDTQWDKSPTVVDGIVGNQADLKSFVKRNFHVYRLLTASYHAWAGDGESSFQAMSAQLANPAAWEQGFLADARTRYASEMSAIHEYAERSGRPLAFLILPTRDAAASVRSTAEPSPANQGDGRPMFPVEQATAIFEEMGARYVDLTTVVGSGARDETFFRFDGHLTPEANQRVADEFLRHFDLRCGRSDSARNPAMEPST